jgi:CRISPR/Cas system Type II protein with McrA/HNH and RuvC-like nuclease domain
LVRQLPETLGINTVGWLLKMTDDESAEVRLSAITLLATCNDPRILAEVEAVARNDSDERIRRQAEMLARRRDDRRR